MANTIALDIGGTNIKIVTIHNNSIADYASIPALSYGKLTDRLDDIEKEIIKLTKGEFNSYTAMGIALPCLVDPKTKRASEIYEKFCDAPTIDFTKWSREKFGLE